ncbi:MAG: hypothetical protein NWE99_02405 [Candidatus Bathyarchaeota archaeon]|nr:hypothetical protein [Candidatus Bathyarchaeota archaeon]
MVMRYRVFIETVSLLEESIGSTEPIYFESIQKLEEVREDLRRLDIQMHLLGLIRPFLIQWGTMARVVGQEGLDWVGFGKAIQNLESDFARLRDKRFLAIDFSEEVVSNAVKKIYEELRRFPKLGGPTVISKVLHLLNPELFVMWDANIRKAYQIKNRQVNEFPEGYLEFLKETQSEVKEAFCDYQRESGKDFDEIEQEIRGKFKNKTLARIIDEYNYSTYSVSNTLHHNKKHRTLEAKASVLMLPDPNKR